MASTGLVPHNLRLIDGDEPQKVEAGGDIDYSVSVGVYSYLTVIGA